MTQNERLLEYLRTHIGITPMVALNELGIYRLSGRIHNLREAGHRIQTIRTKVKTRDGEAIVAEYRLEAGNE